MKTFALERLDSEIFEEKSKHTKSNFLCLVLTPNGLSLLF